MTGRDISVALDADVLQVDVGLAMAVVVGLDDGNGQPLDRHGDSEDRVRGVHISQVPITAIRIAEDREREDLRVPVAADELVANAIPRVQIRMEQYGRSASEAAFQITKGESDLIRRCIVVRPPWIIGR